MSGVPFHYVDLRTFVYDTEDERRVREALELFVPEDTDIDREETTGHLGDRIVVLSVRVETADAIRYVIDRLRAVDVDRLRAELADRIDEDCSFHLHLDKQAAALGSVALGDGIALRAKVEAYPAKRETAIENVREYL
ncbi:MAG: RNA-binding protein [Halobacteriaceae archaeon]